MDVMFSMLTTSTYFRVNINYMQGNHNTIGSQFNGFVA